MKVSNINFPDFLGVQCLMMPYIQGDSSSLPSEYDSYKKIIDETYIKEGDVGFLTIDESIVNKGSAQRAYRAKTARALHTEAGLNKNIYCWGFTWGANPRVTLDRNTEILLANNIDDSCSLWDKEHKETSIDGDIGHASELYPYSEANLMKAGEVHKIGILTPHESMSLGKTDKRQFIRIVGAGVHGRESYFTKNRKLSQLDHD